MAVEFNIVVFKAVVTFNEKFIKADLQSHLNVAQTTNHPCTVGASSSVTRRVLTEVSIESQIQISTHNGFIWGLIRTYFS